MTSSPRHALLVTYSCVPHEWTAEHCVSTVVWWSTSRSTAGICRGISVNYADCTPNPPPACPLVHIVSNTLYWSLAVFDLISSCTAATVSGLHTCRLWCYCKQCLMVSLVRVAVPWTACTVCCPHLLDSQHIIWCSSLPWCSATRLSPSPPPAVNKPTWLLRLTLCRMHLPCVLSMAYCVCSRNNSKTSFRLLLPVSNYKTRNR